jgi:hypothetical protein
LAALGVNRRIDSTTWVLTLPPWHGRIFDVFVLAVDHLTKLVDAVSPLRSRRLVQSSTRL